MPMDGCDCLRCPQSGDRLENNSFPDSYCFRCRRCQHNVEDNLWMCAEIDWDCEYYEVTRRDDHRWVRVNEPEEDIPDTEVNVPTPNPNVRVTDEIATAENYLTIAPTQEVAQ
jgi:hypothetical protein